MKKKIIFILSFISTSLFANPFANPSEPSGKLILNKAHPTQKLFAVTLQAVNGHNVTNRDQAVWLKPGEYELTFSSTVDKRVTKGQLSKNSSKNNNLTNTVTIVVEADKSYYVAFDASDRDRHKWKPVVYKTK